MKRNLLLLAVMAVAMLFFTGQSSAQDLGDPDTIIVETFDCDHEYNADPGSFDSVRCAVYVVHDSNTFYWEGGAKWVQDSIAAFVVPLLFWHQPPGTADSVIFPGHDQWNNVEISPYVPWINRSLFRHIEDTHTGEITYNRMLLMVENFKTAWTVYTDFEHFSCDADSGLCSFSVVPMSATCQRWWEGDPSEHDRALLATLTFFVYMADDADTTEIGIDSTFWPPESRLTFTRHDAELYFPIAKLPVKDTIYIIPCSAPNIVCPTPETQGCNGTYISATQFTATAGNPPPGPGNLVTNVTAAGGGPGITGATVVYTQPGAVPPPAATVIGNVQYTVANHCTTATPIVLTAFNNCVPPLSATCNFNVTLTNVAPTIACPGNMTGTYCNLMTSGPFTATDECPGVTPTVTIKSVVPAPANAPAIAGNTVTWQATCADVGITYTVTLEASDDCRATATCQFTMDATNAPPDITCFGPFSAKTGETVTFFNAFAFTDDCPGASAVAVAALGTVNSNTNTDINYTAPAVAGVEQIIVTVTDACGLTDVCTIDVAIVTVENQIAIPNRVYERFGFEHWVYPTDWENYEFGVKGIFVDDFCYPYEGINPGDFFEIPVILTAFKPAYKIGSFELEIEFDHVDLTFYGAERGILLSHRDAVEDTTYSWEYFAYRLCPCPAPGCLKYKILLFGQAEMPDGLFRRGYCLNPANNFPETFWAVDWAWYQDDQGNPLLVEVGASLVWLKFQVANNELLRDLKLPIKFEWEHKLCGEFPNYYICQDWDCFENSFGSCDGIDLFVSKNEMQYEPDVCGLSQPGGGDIFTILDFVDGGVHICSPCTSFKCVRGDVNLNHVAYDPADPVLLARAIIFGEVVFWDIPTQTCASDVNADGRPIMLADLIYMIRVILNDAIPYPKLGPSSDVATVIVSEDKITVECASAVGGLLFEFDGAVSTTLLNADMEVLANEGRVLVWSREGNSLTAGASEILSVAGAELVSVTAVDREGRDLATTISHKVAPSTFALHPAYPNPFNPYTNLSFTLPNAVPYSMKIYNVAGQLVRTYDGMGQVGTNVITWDGKDNAGTDVSSGLYFFKLSAGVYNATSKMVLMK